MGRKNTNAMTDEMAGIKIPHPCSICLNRDRYTTKGELFCSFCMDGSHYKRPEFDQRTTQQTLFGE